MQMPSHDHKAVDLVFKVLKWYKPDVIVNIGDLADGTGTSRWADGTTEEVFAQAQAESQEVKDYWARVRKAAPNARLIWTEGNHDLRPFDYVDKKAPALKELITPESLWSLSEYGVEYLSYDMPPQVAMGDLYVHHGVAVSKHAGDSVRSDVENWGVSVIRGHSHRMGTFAKTWEMRDETLWGYEIGHLMDESKATYSQVHNWQKGFAIGLEEDGKHHIDLIKINSDYTCYVGGKKFAV